MIFGIIFARKKEMKMILQKFSQICKKNFPFNPRDELTVITPLNNIIVKKSRFLQWLANRVDGDIQIVEEGSNGSSQQHIEPEIIINPGGCGSGSGSEPGHDVNAGLAPDRSALTATFLPCVLVFLLSDSKKMVLLH
jgi:hypothetical protein